MGPRYELFNIIYFLQRTLMNIEIMSQVQVPQLLCKCIEWRYYKNLRLNFIQKLGSSISEWLGMFYFQWQTNMGHTAESIQWFHKSSLIHFVL